MHTTVFEIDHEMTVTVIHNGDWDGNATVLWTDSNGDHKVEMPACLLVRLGEKVAMEHLRGNVISFLEGLEGPPPLRTISDDAPYL